MRDMQNRRPNPREAAFIALGEGKGWEVTRRGWPDFLCFGPDGRVVVVEVTRPDPRGGGLYGLRDSQVRVMRFLAAHGVECLVTDGQVTERFDESRHARRGRRRKGV